MINLINSITCNVLTAIYESLGFSILLAFFFMFFYMFSKKYGWKLTLKKWIQEFRENRLFRYVFFLVLFSFMILFRTLLNRNMWMNPLSDVMGGWWIYDKDGKFTTEAFENVLLFVPFTILLFMVLKLKWNKKCFRLGCIVICSIQYTGLFSLGIEFFQFMFRLGTFQFADLVYNTLGGIIGGLLYYVGCKIVYFINCKKE